MTQNLTIDKLNKMIEPYNDRLLARLALNECVKAMSKIVSNAVRIDGRVSITQDAYAAAQSALARALLELSR